jgi:hypothetical protein
VNENIYISTDGNARKYFVHLDTEDVSVVVLLLNQTRKDSEGMLEEQGCPIYKLDVCFV